MVVSLLLGAAWGVPLESMVVGEASDTRFVCAGACYSCRRDQLQPTMKFDEMTDLQVVMRCAPVAVGGVRLGHWYSSYLGPQSVISRLNCLISASRS